MKSILNCLDIYKALPHRYPMLFADGICEIRYGEYVEGYKNVSFNEPWVVGHFLDEPLLPGIYIIEIMAQVGGFMFYDEAKKDKENQIKAYLVGVNNARFKHKVYPGDQLYVKAKLIEKVGKVIKVKSTAYVNDIVAANAEIIYCFDQEV